MKPIAYPQYKNSGIERIGRVPTHWVVRKTPWVFSIGSGTTPNSEESSYYDGDTPWITTSELRESVITATAKQVTKKALYDYSSLKLHPNGSVAIAMYGATIGRLGILGLPATVNQACCVFSNPQGTDMKFWFYWLQMRRTYLVSLGYGGGQPNLSQELLRSIRVPFPPEIEQGAIAEFLDRETARIDALVEKKEQLIKLLHEKRTALISHAVTKGLNPDVPMKDTGIEWLGQIPTHWEITRASTVCTFINGKAHEQFVEEDGDFLCVTARFVSTGGKSFRRCTVNLCPARRGDVLMVMSDLPLGRALARAFHVDQNDTFAVNQRVCILRPRSIHSRFLLYYSNRNPQLLAHDDGHNQTHLPNSAFKTLKVVLPSSEEQKSIASFLDRETAKIDALIVKVKEAIERLKEYRTALISAAVTGKIDVREGAIVAQEGMPDEPH